MVSWVTHTTSYIGQQASKQAGLFCPVFATQFCRMIIRRNVQEWESYYSQHRVTLISYNGVIFVPMILFTKSAKVHTANYLSIFACEGGKKEKLVSLTCSFSCCILYIRYLRLSSISFGGEREREDWKKLTPRSLMKSGGKNSFHPMKDETSRFSTSAAAPFVMAESNNAPGTHRRTWAFPELSLLSEQ